MRCRMGDGGMSASLLLSRLEYVKGRDGGPWMARCPAHRDRHPSLRVTQLDDGRVLIFCHAGCGAADVMGAVGLTLRDLFPEGSRGTLGPSPIQRNAAISLKTIQHAALKATMLLSDVARAKVVTPAQADLAARLTAEIWQALDAAGVRR